MGLIFLALITSEIKTILHQKTPHIIKITTVTARMLLDLWYKIEMHTMVNLISLSG